MRASLLAFGFCAVLAGCGSESEPPAAAAAPAANPAAAGADAAALPPAAAQQPGDAPEATAVSVQRAEDPQQPPLLEVRAWSRRSGLPLAGMAYDVYWQTDEGPNKTNSITGADGWTRNAFPNFSQLHNLYLQPAPLTAPVRVTLGQMMEPGVIVRVDLVVPPAAIVSGVVLDELGQPVPNAGLAGFHASHLEIDAKERPPADSFGTANADGTFRLGGFPAGPFVLEAGLDSRATVWRLTGVLAEGQVVEGAEIQLETCHNVFGQILDAADQPVSGANVMAGKVGRRQLSRPGPAPELRYVPGRPLLARSDERGTFNLPAVPDGQVWSVVVEHARYKRASARLEPGQVDLLIRLQEGLRVSGTLLLPDGQPAARVVIALVGGAAELSNTVNKQGRFGFAGLDPAENLWIVAHGAGLAPLLHGPLSLAAQSVEGLQLQLPAPQVLGGGVTGPDGKPVEGARVTLMRLDLPAGLPAEGLAPALLGQGSSLTGAGGEFAFGDLAPGRYQVTAQSPDGATQRIETAAGVTGLQIKL